MDIGLFYAAGLALDGVGIAVDAWIRMRGLQRPALPDSLTVSAPNPEPKPVTWAGTTRHQVPVQPRPALFKREDYQTGTEARSALLSRLKPTKTDLPGVREIFFEGEAIGRIAKNPRGLGWVANTDRGNMFGSINDAMLAIYNATR